MRKLFFLCNNCNRLAQDSATRVYLVDHMACRCLFLPVKEQP